MRWIRVSILVMIALLCIPRTVHAQEDGGKIFFYEWNKDGEAIARSRNFEFFENCTTEGKAKILFYALFYRLQDNEKTYVPEGTRLLDTKFDRGVLILNFSEEAEKCYGGEVERLYTQQIQKTACSIPEIQGIIVLVGGKPIDLPEGTEFFDGTKERKHGQDIVCNEEQRKIKRN